MASVHSVRACRFKRKEAFAADVFSEELVEVVAVSDVASADAKKRLVIRGGSRGGGQAEPQPDQAPDFPDFFNFSSLKR